MPNWLIQWEAGNNNFPTNQNALMLQEIRTIGVVNIFIRLMELKNKSKMKKAQWIQRSILERTSMIILPISKYFIVFPAWFRLVQNALNQQVEAASRVREKSKELRSWESIQILEWELGFGKRLELGFRPNFTQPTYGLHFMVLRMVSRKLGWKLQFFSLQVHCKFHKIECWSE